MASPINGVSVICRAMLNLSLRAAAVAEPSPNCPNASSHLWFG